VAGADQVGEEPRISFTTQTIRTADLVQ
jgi:hypothetical protein